VKKEEREMKPYQEKTDVVNLGTGGEKKEVKIGTCVSANV